MKILRSKASRCACKGTLKPCCVERRICSIFCHCCISRICSIQVIFSFLFFISMAALGVAVTSIFYSYSMENVNLLFSKNQDLLEKYTTDFTSDFLQQGEEVLEFAKLWMDYHYRENLIDLDFPRETEFGLQSYDRAVIFFYGLVSVLSDISLMGFGGRNGNVLMVGPGKNAWTNETKRANPCCWYTLNDLTNPGNLTGLPDRVWVRKISDDLVFGNFRQIPGQKRFDFRLNDWYSLPYSKSGLNDTTSVWFNRPSANGQFLTTMSHNYFDPSGEFRGVFNLEFFLEESFNTFLSSLNLQDGMLFLIDQSTGLLIASSSPDHIVFIEDEETGVKTRTLCIDAPETLIRDACRFLLSDYDSKGLNEELSDIRRVTDQTFLTSLDGDTYHLFASSLELSGDYRILNIYIVRDRTVFGKVYQGNVISITICLSCVFIMSLLTGCIICVVLHPVSRLASQMRKIETLKLDKIRIPWSLFRETRQLQQRFKTCVKMLKRFKPFLPQYILDNPLQDPQKDDIEAENEEEEVCSQQSSERSDDYRSSTTSNSKSAFSEGSSSRNTPVSPMRYVTRRRSSKFDVGVHRRQIICLRITIANWESLLCEDSAKYMKDYSTLLTFLSTLTRRFGNIHAFFLDHIIMYYPRSSIRHAMQHILEIARSGRHLREYFRVVVVATLESTLVGTIGSDILKSSCLFHGGVEKSQFITKCFLSRYFHRRSESFLSTFYVGNEEEEEDSEEEIILVENNEGKETWMEKHDEPMKQPQTQQQDIEEEIEDVEDDESFEMVLNYRQLPQIKILLDSNFELETRSVLCEKKKGSKMIEMSIIPCNIYLYMPSSKFVVVYSVVLDDHGGDDDHNNEEWMYQFDREERGGINILFKESFIHLLEDEVEIAQKKIKKYFSKKESSLWKSEGNNNNDDGDGEKKMKNMEVKSHLLNGDLNPLFLSQLIQKIEDEQEEGYGLTDFLKINVLKLVCHQADSLDVQKRSQRLRKIFEDSSLLFL